MELGNRIKGYRTALKLTQDDLAEKVFVTRQTISNWENDKSYPDVHSLVLLGNIFNVTLDQLVKGDIEIMKEKINQKDIQKFRLISGNPWLFNCRDESARFVHI